MKRIDKIELSKRMGLFGKYLSKLGFGLLVLGLIVSSIFSLSIIYMFYEPYREICVLLLKIINTSISLTVFGIIVYYLFYFIEDLLIKKGFKNFNERKKRKTKK